MVNILLKEGEEVVKRTVGSDGRISLGSYKNRDVTVIIHVKNKEEVEYGVE